MNGVVRRRARLTAQKRFAGRQLRRTKKGGTAAFPPFVGMPRFCLTETQKEGDHMAEWITGLFSSTPGLSRVRPSGLIVMAIGLIIAIVGGICFRGAENRRKSLLVRLIGLLVTAAGTLLAIY